MTVPFKRLFNRFIDDRCTMLPVETSYLSVKDDRLCYKDQTLFIKICTNDPENIDEDPAVKSFLEDVRKVLIRDAVKDEVGDEASEYITFSLESDVSYAIYDRDGFSTYMDPEILKYIAKRHPLELVYYITKDDMDDYIACIVSTRVRDMASPYSELADKIDYITRVLDMPGNRGPELSWRELQNDIGKDLEKDMAATD